VTALRPDRTEIVAFDDQRIHYKVKPNHLPYNPYLVERVRMGLFPPICTDAPGKEGNFGVRGCVSDLRLLCFPQPRQLWSVEEKRSVANDDIQVRRAALSCSSIS
jgi:hypothetical protein